MQHTFVSYPRENFRGDRRHIPFVSLLGVKLNRERCHSKVAMLCQPRPKTISSIPFVSHPRLKFRKRRCHIPFGRLTNGKLPWNGLFLLQVFRSGGSQKVWVKLRRGRCQCRTPFVSCSSIKYRGRRHSNVAYLVWAARG